MKSIMAEIIYIAGPYSHVSQLVRDERETVLTQAAAICAKHGHIVCSPITHSAPLERAGLELTQHDWLAFNEPFMELATRMLWLKIDGWQDSQGLTWEIEFFRHLKKPVTGLIPDLVEAWAKNLGGGG